MCIDQAVTGNTGKGEVVARESSAVIGLVVVFAQESMGEIRTVGNAVYIPRVLFAAAAPMLCHAECGVVVG